MGVRLKHHGGFKVYEEVEFHQYAKTPLSRWQPEFVIADFNLMEVLIFPKFYPTRSFWTSIHRIRKPHLVRRENDKSVL